MARESVRNAVKTIVEGHWKVYDDVDETLIDRITAYFCITDYAVTDVLEEETAILLMYDFLRTER